MPIISAKNLTKTFNSFVAVNAINFEVRRGEYYGLLGPNGAGKTSTMKMIYCMSPVGGGTLEVLNYNVMVNPRQIKQNIGVVSQEDNLDPDLSVLANLQMYASYFDIPKAIATERADELLSFLNLKDFAKYKIDKISGGMRRRLMIARALINQPKLLILDEPTTGLDPQARHLIWGKLRQLKQQGVTMVLTTHYMEEAELLCDRIALMDGGKILIEDSPQKLIQDHNVASLEELFLKLTGHGLRD
ncbi:MAG: ABC transporter ATP-binding protein [Deltaproteobacteria bacterium]|nr:ABC transporter ATP-binding protein [Deltaproteobacteria bacterium]